MSELTPTIAALLAAGVYDVQKAKTVDDFLDLPYFKPRSESGASPHVHLKAEVGGWLVLNYKDGFGVCAQGGKGYENEVFLIFRGTTAENKKADFLTDARMGLTPTSAGLPVHCGFYHCFTSMLPEIKRFFNTQGGHVTTVHCVGHSLGGAIATLAADWVTRALKYPTKLYTFGSPRVGTDLFVRSITSAIGPKNIHRVYHRTDPVTMIPLYPFTHVPYREVGHYIYSTFPTFSGDGHRMINYIPAVKGKTWTALKDIPIEAYGVEASIEDWLKSKSRMDTSSAAFWRWTESALHYIIKKIGLGIAIGVDALLFGGSTVADKVAYILRKGIDLSKNISIWVVHLMRKLMEALGIAVAKTKEALTHSLITYVLTRLTEKATSDARNALRQI